MGEIHPDKHQHSTLFIYYNNLTRNHNTNGWSI